MAKKGKRFWIWLILLAILAIIVVFAVYKSKSKPKGIAVEFEKVQARDIDEKVAASGRIFPEKEIKISSDVSGEIKELYVAEGDSVVIGQLLAKIDPESYVSSVERGKASLSGAKSQLAVSKSQLEANKAQKEQISAQLGNAQKIHDRNKTLLADGVISQADLDQSLANLENLQANLRASQASIRSSEESIKGSQFNVESMAATLRELQTNLGRTTIKAPATGIISSLSVEEGERVVGTIQMTGTEMMRIANLNSMEAQVDVSENDIVRVQLGDKVDVEVDAFLDKKIQGSVTEIANSASNLTGAAGMSLNTDQVTNFIVKVRLDPDSYKHLIKANQRYPFRPGMSASVDIYTENEKDAIAVPIQSVTVREMEEDSIKKGKEEMKEVVFVKGGDTVAMREIKTGIQDDEYIQVLSGLEKDEEIIVGPYSAISGKLEEGKQVYEKKEDDKNSKKE